MGRRAMRAAKRRGDLADPLLAAIQRVAAARARSQRAFPWSSWRDSNSRPSACKERRGSRAVAHSCVIARKHWGLDESPWAPSTTPNDLSCLRLPRPSTLEALSRVG